VAVYSQSGSTVADALSGAFAKAYPDIKIEYSGTGGAELATKLITEHQAGKATADVALHGTTTLFDLVKAGALDPLEPALGGPDLERSKWMGGKLVYADDAEKYVLMMTAGVSAPFIYNSNTVSASDFKSWKDLLNPKWKDKLAMFDPRVAGNGTAMAQFWYLTPSLGKDFIKQLFTQNVTLSKDDRQLSDWVGRGQFAIGVAAQGFEAIQLKKNGVPIEFMRADNLQEGSFFTTSFGSVGLVNKGPHPNAAKVYLNWLLSKQGQESLAGASGYPSRRTDASTSGLLEAGIPKPGAQYLELNQEQYVRQRPESIDYVKSVIPN